MNAENPAGVSEHPSIHVIPRAYTERNAQSQARILISALPTFRTRWNTLYSSKLVAESHTKTHIVAPGQLHASPRRPVGHETCRSPSPESTLGSAVVVITSVFGVSHVQYHDIQQILPVSPGSSCVLNSNALCRLRARKCSRDRQRSQSAG